MQVVRVLLPGSRLPWACMAPLVSDAEDADIHVEYGSQQHLLS